MTIKEARKILGKLAKGMSDEDIRLDIESADLIKNLFFENLTTRNNKLVSFPKMP